MVLDGKYRVKKDNKQLKSGDTIEFVEGFSTCSGLCSACEILKSIKTQEELIKVFPDIKLEKVED